jgi:hypothetical protein
VGSGCGIRRTVRCGTAPPCWKVSSTPRGCVQGGVDLDEQPADARDFVCEVVEANQDPLLGRGFVADIDPAQRVRKVRAASAIT